MIRYINTSVVEDFIKNQKLSHNSFCKGAKIGYSTFMKLMYGNADNCLLSAVFKMARFMKIEAKDLFSDK